MISLECLAALDLLQWLGTTERAAELAHANQSTISRRHRTALHTFDLRLVRGAQGLILRGSTELLALERQVHQHARFLGLQPLRLQVPFWSRHRALQVLPEPWCVNPPALGVVCEDPVTLLRERVLDACLVTPTQLPAATDDLLLLDLYRRPIEFTLFHCDHGPAAGEQGFAPERLALQLMPFLPRSCCERSQEWFTALLRSAAVVEPAARAADRCLPVAFLTPEMREAQERPCWVSDAVDAYPYVERLAVLAEHASEPAVLQLQAQLSRQMAPLQLAC